MRLDRLGGGLSRSFQTLFILFINILTNFKFLLAYFSQPSMTRQLNTTQRNNAATVDLVFLPSMEDIEAPAVQLAPRVPVFPEFNTHGMSEPHIDAVEEPPAPMKPQISTVANSAASAMSEVVDNHSVEIDPFTLTETVGRSRQGEELKKQQAADSKGPIQQFWSGFLDDLLGPKEQATASKK